MMGLLEQKRAKYMKILITKARCTVHKKTSLLVNVSSTYFLICGTILSNEITSSSDKLDIFTARHQLRN